MTDYAELRAALEAGPTPGPWSGRTDGLDAGLATDCAIHTWERCIAQITDNPLNQRDMAYIAAANPEAIRALLEERDSLIHDNAEYVGAASALATENQRLRAALDDIIGMAEAGRMIHVINRARTALAQGQEET